VTFHDFELKPQHLARLSLPFRDQFVMHQTNTLLDLCSVWERPRSGTAENTPGCCILAHSEKELLESRKFSDSHFMHSGLSTRSGLRECVGDFA
jgi:hypothetical protein